MPSLGGGNNNVMMLLLSLIIQLLQQTQGNNNEHGNGTYPAPTPASGATNDNVSTPVNTATTINVVSNDNGGNNGSVQSFTQPANGTVTRSGNDLVYTPNNGFQGNDSFTYVNSNGATATVNVGVGNGAAPAPNPGYNFSGGTTKGISMIQLNGDGTATLMGPNTNFTLTGVKEDANGVITASGGQGIINGKESMGKPYKGNVFVIGPDANSVKHLQTAPGSLANHNAHGWFSGIGDLHSTATLK